MKPNQKERDQTAKALRQIHGAMVPKPKLLMMSSEPIDSPPLSIFGKFRKWLRRIMPFILVCLLLEGVALASTKDGQDIFANGNTAGEIQGLGKNPAEFAKTKAIITIKMQGTGATVTEKEFPKFTQEDIDNINQARQQLK